MEHKVDYLVKKGKLEAERDSKAVRAVILATERGVLW